jgi:LsmAD domain/Ataxin 2 SM domain
MATRDSWRRGNPTEVTAQPRARPPSQSAASSAASSASSSGAGMDDPAVVASVAAHIGKVVVVSTVDGLRYEGVLTASSATTPASVVLRNVKPPVEGTKSSAVAPSHATRAADGKHVRTGEPGVQTKSILVSQLVRVIPKEKELSASTAGVAASTKGSPTPSKTAESTVLSGFATDTEISFGSYEQSGPGRQLKPFGDFTTPEKEEHSKSRKASALGEDEMLRGHQRWDQFEDNKRLFGVTTSFNEHDYTTRINKQDPHFAKRMAEAERLAAEIELRDSTNSHVREERGLALLDGHGDEEDRFSGVRRPVSTRSPPVAPDSNPRRSYAAATSSGGAAKSTTSFIVEPVASRPPRSPQTERGPPFPSPSQAASAGVLLPPAVASLERPETQPTSRAAPSLLTNNRRSRENLAQFARQPISGRASPTQSRNSPLVRPSAPSTPNTAAIRNLSLEAQTPGVGPEAVKQFEKFRAEREIRSVLEDRDRITEEFKKFSNDHPVSRSRTAPKTESVSPSPMSPAPVAVTENLVTEPLLAKIDIGENPDVGDSLKAVAKDGVEGPEAGKATDTNAEPKRSLKAFKLNPNAPSFDLNPDAPEFQPSLPPVVMPSNIPDFEYSNNLLPAGHLSGPVGQDMSMYMNMYMPDPNISSSTMGGYVPGPYRSTGMVNYGMQSQPLQSPMGQSMMHPGAVPGSFPGMNRPPYGMPYQGAMGQVPQGRSFVPNSQPYGMTVLPSAVPPQAQVPSPYVQNPGYSFSNNQAGVQVPPVSPSMIPLTPMYYPQMGSSGGRVSGVNRSRRGGRGGSYRQSHIPHGQSSQPTLHHDAESASDVTSRSSTDLSQQIPVQSSPK